MTSSEESTFDPSRRRLCPDGSCTGLVDDRGTCGECGRSFENLPPAAGPAAKPAPASIDDPDDAADVLPFAPPGEGPAGGFDPARKLCPDGACVGIIGPNGRCTECGRPAVSPGGGA